MSDKLILCQHCIHREVCGHEGVDDPALTFCDDYLPISGWISVKDRLPEDSGDYMVLNDGRIEIAPYDKEAAQEGLYPFGYEDKEIDEIGNTLIDWIEISGVTHWMPLPEPPPKEETYE